MLGDLYSPVLDSRDKGKVIIIAHIYLLLGCAMPLWLGYSLKLHESYSLILMSCGIISIGIADTLASLIG
jgi:dolichol kinase